MENAEIRELVRKELLEVRPYQPGKPLGEVKRELGLVEVVKMASNENPLGPSPLAIKALEENLSQINLYPDGGAYYLKQGLAEYLNLSPSNIILGNGSNEVIQFIVDAFLNPGDEAIIAEPAFLIYRIVLSLRGGRIKAVTLKNFRYDLPGIAESITPRTKLIFIDNPNNPTGTTVGAEEVNSFLEKVPPQVIVVLDEAYFEYVEDKNFPFSLDYVKRGYKVVVLRTFSKAYGLAGLRIGYGVAREDIVGFLEKVRQPFNTNSLAQVAALAALKDSQHLRRTKELNSLGKRYLYDYFSKRGIFHIPSQTNFILVDLKKDAREIFRKLLEKGVVVRPMSAYGLSTFIRVTVGTQKQNEKFIRALDSWLTEEGVL